MMPAGSESSLAIARNENPTSQVLTHAGKARGFVGSRDDHCELHALRDPKVPIHHVANVYSEPKFLRAARPLTVGVGLGRPHGSVCPRPLRRRLLRKSRLGRAASPFHRAGRSQEPHHQYSSGSPRLASAPRQIFSRSSAESCISSSSTTTFQEGASMFVARPIAGASEPCTRRLKVHG